MRLSKTRILLSKEWEGLREIIRDLLGVEDPEWNDVAQVLSGLCRNEAGEGCPSCKGEGVRMYSHGSTWRGGVGVAGATLDVCDVCWGSGIASKPWVDLRALFKSLEKAQKESSLEWFSERIGGHLARAQTREQFLKISEKMRRVRWAASDFWYSQTIQRVSDVLEEMSRE